MQCDWPNGSCQQLGAWGAPFQDRVLVTEGCRLREAAQNIVPQLRTVTPSTLLTCGIRPDMSCLSSLLEARHDAPHSAVARFNRNMEFNITTPLKDSCSGLSNSLAVPDITGPLGQQRKVAEGAGEARPVPLLQGTLPAAHFMLSSRRSNRLFRLITV